MLEKLRAYGAKAGIKEDKIVEQYKKIIESEKAKGKDEEAAAQLAILRIRASVKSDIKDNAEFFEGVILSPGSKNAYLANKYNIAKREYEADPEDAIDQGLVNEEGEPLDNREYFGSGKPNPDFGKVITEIDYGSWNNQKLTYEDKGGQDVIGLCKRINGDEVKQFKMTLFDGAGRLPIEIGKPIKFKAVVREESKEKLVLGVSQKTELNNTIDENPFNVAQVIESGLLGELTELNDMKKWFTNNKSNYEAFFITQGVVESMNLNGSKINTITLSDMSLDLENLDLESEDEYRIWLPKTSRIDFLEGTIIYVFGGNKHWITKEGVINMQEAGIYAPPEYKVDLNESDELNEMIDEDFEEEGDISFSENNDEMI